MSHFYASIQGSRGEATRQGGKESGIYGHIRGWHIGAEVSCYYDKDKNIDEVHICITGGSGYIQNRKGIVKIIFDNNEEIITREFK